MKLLILPGNSPRHRQWALTAQQVLNSQFEEIRIVTYRHWETGDERADVDYEVEAAASMVADWDEYVIMAKSIGTIIAALGHQKGRLTAYAYSLLGLPLHGVIDNHPELKNLISSLAPATLFQNEQDPLGGTDEVRLYLSDISANGISVIGTLGNTHDYLDFTTYCAPFPHD